ncbi:unnamed protein product, partial [Medioppia subpectinata]
MNDLVKLLVAFVVLVVIQVSKQEDESTLIASDCMRCQAMERQCAAVLVDKR